MHLKLPTLTFRLPFATTTGLFPGFKLGILTFKPLAGIPQFRLDQQSGFQRPGQILLGNRQCRVRVGGAIGITYAHELIHKPTALERNAGGVLLSLVAYGGFKVEHVFGHHVDVATPRDTSTARLGQSAYAFLLRSLLLNPVRAWQLAGARLRARGLPAWHWRNEMYLWHGLTLLFAAGMMAWLGWAGLAFFALQALVAITLLELVNYIEHYGLLRRRRPDGSYERVTPRHSWNDSHHLSNLALLNLQRHSDHHAFAARRYQVLRHHDDAPQLPTGYASLVLLALLPPLWRHFMDPRVAAWKAAETA